MVVVAAVMPCDRVKTPVLPLPAEIVLVGAPELNEQVPAPAPVVNV